MNNVVLSPNVKAYFVNALKGLGLGLGPNPDSYTEEVIVNIIDNPNTTFDAIYDLIKCSVLFNLGVDAQTEKYLQKNTVFNRQIAKGILKTKSNNLFSDDAYNTFLRDLTASGVNENGNRMRTNPDAVHLNSIVETVIETLKQGLVNQKLTKAEKLEAETIWRRIKHAKFEQWLINTNNYQANDFELWIRNGQSNNSQNNIDYSKLNQEYRYKEMKSQMVNATKTLLQTNDDNLARRFLNKPIQGDEKNQLVAELQGNLKKKLKVDRNLLERSAHFWRERCKVDGIQQVQLPNNGNPKNVAPDDVEVKDLLEIENDGLTLIDVLAAAGDYQTQIVTFFQTRSRVQWEKQKADPKNSGVKEKNKIGNLMGKAGRDYVKKETGVKAAVAYSTSKLKKGKGGPWKGLKELFQKVSNSMKEFWNKLPAVSFVEKILNKERGYSLSAGMENKDKEKGNDVSEEEQLKELFASDYEPMPASYAGTLAENFYQKTKARLLADKARVARYQAEIADHSVDAKKFNACKVYLEKRITAAEDALNKIPDVNSPRFNDQTYYDDLEKEIMAAGIDNNASAQDKQFVQDFLNHNQNNTQNDEMVNALKQLEITNQNQTVNMQKAKREIATLMFGMQKKVENGQINDANLDNMTKDFFDVKNGHYQKVKMALQSNARVMPDDVMERMNKFAIGELHEKIFNEKSDRYSSIQHGKQFNEAAKEELTDLGMTI